MKFTNIPTFRSATGRTVQFFPIADPVLRQSAPFRVVIDGTAVDWLSKGFRPNIKSARFFLEKHEKKS